MADEEDDIEIVMEDEVLTEGYQKPITFLTTSKTDAGTISNPLSPSGATGTSSQLGSNDGGATIAKSLALTGHLDLMASGLFNFDGQNIFNVDLDSFEDKPWRKPGADITDYFNYGFDENLWRIFCQKQKGIRDENIALRKTHTFDGDKPKTAASSNAPRYGFGSPATPATVATTATAAPVTSTSITTLGSRPQPAAQAIPVIGMLGSSQAPQSMTTPHFRPPPPPPPISVNGQGGAPMQPQMMRPLPPPHAMMPYGQQQQQFPQSRPPQHMQPPQYPPPPPHAFGQHPSGSYPSQPQQPPMYPPPSRPPYSQAMPTGGRPPGLHPPPPPPPPPGAPFSPYGRPPNS